MGSGRRIVCNLTEVSRGGVVLMAKCHGHASSGFYATASIDEYGLHLKLGCLGSEQLGDVLGCPARIYPEVIRGL